MLRPKKKLRKAKKISALRADFAKKKLRMPKKNSALRADFAKKKLVLVIFWQIFAKKNTGPHYLRQVKEKITQEAA